MEEEITKEKFKYYYFNYATPNSGWTEDYWNHFYEKEGNIILLSRRHRNQQECLLSQTASNTE